MRLDPQKRPSAARALTHPWIRNLAQIETNPLASKNCLFNLSQYQNASKLKRATQKFITSHLATKKMTAELSASFKEFDINGDGHITKDEFLQTYRKLHPELSEAEIVEQVNRQFAIADEDGSGKIEYSEWQAACIN